MTEQKLNELDLLIKKVDGLVWLVRTDEVMGYFLHIFHDAYANPHSSIHSRLNARSLHSTYGRDLSKLLDGGIEFMKQELEHDKNK